MESFVDIDLPFSGAFYLSPQDKKRMFLKYGTPSEEGIKGEMEVQQALYGTVKKTKRGKEVKWTEGDDIEGGVDVKLSGNAAVGDRSHRYFRYKMNDGKKDFSQGEWDIREDIYAYFKDDEGHISEYVKNDYIRRSHSKYHTIDRRLKNGGSLIFVYNDKQLSKNFDDLYRVIESSVSGVQGLYEVSLGTRGDLVKQLNAFKTDYAGNPVIAADVKPGLTAALEHASKYEKEAIQNFLDENKSILF